MQKLFLLFTVLLLCSLEAKENLKTYRFGYINSSMSNYSPKDLKITMDLWMQEVTKNLGNVEMVFYSNPNQAAKDLQVGYIDFLSAFPIVFVKYFNRSEFSDGFTGKYKNPEDNRFILVVKRGVTQEHLQSIQNVKVGIQRNDEIMDMFSNIYFKHPKIVKYDNRSRVILELFFSKLDVAIVPLRTYSLAKELNPQVAKRTKILLKTDFVSNALGYYRKGISQEDKDYIYKTGVELFNTTKGQQMMDIYKIETLVHTQVSDLDNASKLYEEYKKQKEGQK